MNQGVNTEQSGMNTAIVVVGDETSCTSSASASAGEEVEVIDTDTVIPLGISLYALLPFSHYLQELAKDRCDNRIYLPRIELIKQFRPDYITKYWGLPTTVSDLIALGIDKVKVMSKAMFIFVNNEDENDINVWISALRSPIKTTGDFCQCILKQDTAPHNIVDKAPVSCSYVEYLQQQSVTCDDTGRCLWGPASHFVR
jgi:hypothetical protein